MKKLAITLFIILFSATLSYAEELTFAWDANSESDLAGYKLYKSTISGSDYSELSDISLSALSDVSNPTYSVEVSPDGTYYFVLTAYDPDLESDYSEEVEYTVNENPPQAPTSLQIQ